MVNFNPDPIVQELQAGHKSLRQIAIEHNVSHVGLSAWLLRETGDQYHEAITKALTLRVAQADEELATAKDSIAIARARELAKFTRMDLERRRPHLYGMRPMQLTVANIQVDPSMLGSAGELLEHVTGKAEEVANSGSAPIPEKP